MSRITRKKSKTILSCSHELQSFHQFSGQCWSDSAANLLFFAAGVGGKVQAGLQADDVVEKLDSWLRKKENLEKYREEYDTDNTPGLTHFTDEEYYNIFIPAMKEYVHCLQLRYFNMREMTDVRTKRRASCVYSLCKEEKGALAAEVLIPKEKRFESLDKVNKKSLERRMKEMSKLTVDIETLSTHELVGKSEKGYTNLRFGNVIGILLDFFTKGELFKIDRMTSLISGENLGFVIDTKASSITKEIDDHYYLSSVATVVEPLGSHAITLLTCDNGREYIYDDNRSVLKEIPWTNMLGPDTDSVLYVSRYIEEDKTYEAFIDFLKKSQHALKEGIKNGKITNAEINRRNIYNEDFLEIEKEIPNTRALLDIDFEKMGESPVLKFIYEKQPTLIVIDKKNNILKLLTKERVTKVNMYGKDKLFTNILEAYDWDFKTLCFMRISADAFWLTKLAYTVMKRVGVRSKSKSKSKSKKASNSK